MGKKLSFLLMSSMRTSTGRYWAKKKRFSQKVQQRWYVRQIGDIIDVHGHAVDCQIFLQETWSDGTVSEKELKPREAKGGKYLRVRLDGAEVYFHRIVGFAFGKHIASKVPKKWNTFAAHFLDCAGRAARWEVDHYNENHKCHISPNLQIVTGRVNRKKSLAARR